jgi:hypothetical protein
MLRSVKQFYGDRLGATDGEIGKIKDFYFDDQQWAVRYLVADTGSWLTGRKVLLSPYVLRKPDSTGKVLAVNLSRKQIEDSPPIESHKPVSRRYEEEYYQYYGWPFYWQGDALWGMSGFPILETGAPIIPGESTTPDSSVTADEDAHLRSTAAVTGYHLQATDGIIGHVSDFIVDDKSWAIPHLVVKTGSRFSGKEVLVPTTAVIRFSYDESTVFVDLTSAAVEQAPPHDLTPTGALV